MTNQLALKLRLQDGSSFENFYLGGNNEAMDRLRRLLDEHPPAGPATLFLWGETASGKSHLLQAACRFVRSREQLPLYVPLGDPDVHPRLLEGAEDAFLICLDDVQQVAGDAAWESALFALYEFARASGARLVAAATAAPSHLGLTMPDLATRLAWGPVYQLQPLTDADKVEAVCLRARNRGLDLAPDVAGYILRRYPRDLNSLFALLERIDVASLASQRRITIPFLREMQDLHGAT